VSTCGGSVGVGVDIGVDIGVGIGGGVGGGACGIYGQQACLLGSVCASVDQRLMSGAECHRGREMRFMLIVIAMCMKGYKKFGIAHVVKEAVAQRIFCSEALRWIVGDEAREQIRCPFIHFWQVIGDGRRTPKREYRLVVWKLGDPRPRGFARRTQEAKYAEKLVNF